MKSLLVFICWVFILPFVAFAQQTPNKQLAAKILADKRLDTIQQRTLSLLNGFSAGTSYNEVWIRDLNTC